MSPRVPLDGFERKVLMELQYHFPLTPTPYCDAASRLGVDVGSLLEVLRRLHREGVLKRIGYYYNYRSQGKTAALVAFAAGDRYQVLAGKANRDPEVTHNYLRDHPYYNVWIVVKRRSREEIIDFAAKLASETGARDWVILYGKKTFKLSVKYDLYQGVSRAGPYSLVAENPPRPEDLGIDPGLPAKLRRLPLEEHPYRAIASGHGYSEEEVIGLVKEMLRHGILGDPGAALDGHRLGFRVNAMIVTRGGPETCTCASGLEYSTHVVLREPYPPGKWNYNCYFMVHATRRETVERVVEEFKNKCGTREALPIYSLADLKPGVTR